MASDWKCISDISHPIEDYFGKNPLGKSLPSLLSHVSGFLEARAKPNWELRRLLLLPSSTFLVIKMHRFIRVLESFANFGYPTLVWIGAKLTQIRKWSSIFKEFLLETFIGNYQLVCVWHVCHSHVSEWDISFFTHTGCVTRSHPKQVLHTSTYTHETRV